MSLKNIGELQDTSEPSSPLRRSVRLRNAACTPLDLFDVNQKKNSTTSRTPIKTVKTKCLSATKDTFSEKDATSHTENEELPGESNSNGLPQIEEFNSKQPYVKMGDKLLTKQVSNIQGPEERNINLQEKNISNSPESQRNLLGIDSSINPKSENKSVERVYNISSENGANLTNTDETDVINHEQVQNKVTPEVKNERSGDNHEAIKDELINLVAQDNCKPVSSIDDHVEKRVISNNTRKEALCEDSAKLINKDIFTLRDNIIQDNESSNTVNNFAEESGALTHSSHKHLDDSQKRFPGTDVQQKHPVKSNIELSCEEVITKSVTSKETDINQALADDLGNNNKIKKEDNKDVVENSSLDCKIDELLSNACDSSSSESDGEQNSFLDNMAEEGEEDTPSEGSNDIIEVGEEINTTESDFSTDQSYDRDSFIDDEERNSLLSGEEFDLSIEDNKKRRRIMQLSSGSDEEIIKIWKPAQKKEKIRKKSRIIRYEDSSDEDSDKNNQTIQLESDFVQQSATNPSDTERVSNVKQINENSLNEELTNSYESKLEEVSTLDCCTITDEKESLPIAAKPNELVLDVKSSDESKEVPTGNNDSDAKEDENFDKHTQKIVLKGENNQISAENSLGDIKMSPERSFSVSSNSDNVNKKVVILENIKVQDICNKDLGNHINTVVNSLFYGIKKSGEVSINLSLDCSSEDLETTIPDGQHSKHIMHRAYNDSNLTCITEEQVLNIETDKKYKKRRNKKFKTNTRLEVMGNSNAQMQFRKGEKKISKEEKKHSIPLALSNGVENVKIDSPQNRKRKRSLSENVHQSINQNKAVKKRRIKQSQVKVDLPENTKLSILTEAILNDRKKIISPTQEELPLDNTWKVHKISVKPSSDSQNTKSSNTMSKSSKSENIMKNKFHHKDFRNLMCYDSTRIKRVETKQLVRKIC